MNKTTPTKSSAITPWKFDIYIVTWNVASKHPDCVSVTNLLGLGKTPSCDMNQPDFYAIALQEVNSQPQNQVLGLFKDDPWTIKFKEVLKARDYVAVKTEQMQGLLLTLFSKRDHLLHLHDIEAEFTRTGFGGIWGNKGAVSIRLNIYGSTISFVAAHLAAHDHELEERIADYKQILDNHHYHVKKSRHIFDHDYVFWFGDLNFRLTGTDSAEDVLKLVQEEQFEKLIERDQLLAVRSEQRAFHQLEERLPAFPPTFKFKEGTSEYDLKRRPAWTDRILFKVQPDKYPNITLSLEQMSYKSHPGYNISDHKPVTSEFIVRITRNPVMRCFMSADLLDDDISNDQVFEDVHESLVEFTHIPIWMIGEENHVEYWLPIGFEEQNSDWIGVYHKDFASLSEYVAYEYVNQGEQLRPHSVSNDRCAIRINFAETIDLNDGDDYLLVYFKNTGIRGVTSVAGMSNVFRAEKRPPSPRFEEVD